MGVFCLSFSVSGQYFSDSLRYEEPMAPAKIIVKLDLLSVFDTYSNILLAVEYRVKPDFYLQHAIGFVTGYNNYDFDEGELNDPIGLKIKNEFRFYFDYRRQSTKGFYLAPEITYSYIYADKRESVGINCGNGCDFIMLVEYMAVRQSAGLNLKLGSQRIYKEKITLEYFLGIGPKYIWYDSDVDVPDNAGSSFLTKENNLKYNLTIGFKIGLLLK